MELDITTADPGCVEAHEIVNALWDLGYFVSVIRVNGVVVHGE